MNTAVLRQATYRKRGFREWQHGARRISYAVPRLGMWPSSPLMGWHLQWSVEARA